MSADDLLQAIAEAWDDIVKALGDGREEFERRLTPLLRELETTPGTEQANAVLALFKEYPPAEAVLLQDVRRGALRHAKGAYNASETGRKDRYCVVPVYYGTDRAVTGPVDAPSSYGPDRGAFAVGVAEVSIPDDHRMGRIERPSIWKLEFREDPNKHVMLWGLRPMTADEFRAHAKGALARSAKKEVLLFVHGYNVTFEEAVMRTAQIAYDLHFEGVPFVYSWPSEGSVPRYTVDETNVLWSRPRFAEFLAMLREQLDADTIHIIAHSMGNRLVTETVPTLSTSAQGARIRQVVLAAPDVDAATFKDLAAAFRQKAERVTLYASSNDKTMMASKVIHKYPRAGESGVHLVVMDSIDTVDATAVDTSLLGHSYYGDNRSVMTDIFELIRRGTAPVDRFGMKGMKRYGVPYWVFNP